MTRFFKSTLFTLILSTASLVQAQNWTERLNFSNDFRFRNEYMATTHSSGHPFFRQRMRARLGLAYDVNDQVSTAFKIASGSEDPASTNQTFDGGFTSKEINIDEAFVNWKPLRNLQLIGGKTTPIFEAVGKNEMLWDSDLRPEGMAFRYETTGSWIFTANGALYWVDQNQNEAQQILLSGVQVAAKGALTEAVSLKVGAGIYDYSHMEGHRALDFASTSPTPPNSYGNSLSGDNYAGGFQPLEGFVRLNFPVQGKNLELFFDAVTNPKAKDTRKKDGFITGLVWGGVKDKGDFSFRYSYREVKADAVVGAFQSSDFNDGKTGGQGHEVGFGYGLAEKTSVNLTGFFSKTQIGGDQENARGQLDFLFSF